MKSKVEKLGKEKIIKLLNDSKSLREVLTKIGYDTNGSGGYQTFSRYCKLNNIKIPKYNYYGNNRFLEKLDDSEVFIENSTYSRSSLKKRIINKNFIEYKCEKCDNKGEWMNEKLSLQLEHKNGINDDNRLENLCFLCPNCHTQTISYSSRNRKYKSRKKKSKCKCGKSIYSSSSLCQNCWNIKQRKVERPSYKKLLKDINELNWTNTGKKYGVSDNTIRKWKKHYENLESKPIGE